MTAFSQCSGNSRSFFRPQVPGAQLTNGAMGNARYVGARLKDVLKAAGVKAGAVEASLAAWMRLPCRHRLTLRSPLPSITLWTGIRSWLTK